MNLECDKLQPATGFFQCDTKNMAAESSCHFKCPLGLLPGGERKTTCKKTIDEIDNSTSFNWDKDVSDFGCVSTIRYEFHIKKCDKTQCIFSP